MKQVTLISKKWAPEVPQDWYEQFKDVGEFVKWKERFEMFPTEKFPKIYLLGVRKDKPPVIITDEDLRDALKHLKRTQGISVQLRKVIYATYLWWEEGQLQAWIVVEKNK